MGEAIINYLGAVGIKLKLTPLERDAFFAVLATKKLRGLCVCASAKGFEVTMNLSPWPERTFLPDAGEVVAT